MLLLQSSCLILADAQVPTSTASIAASNRCKASSWNNSKSKQQQQLHATQVYYTVVCKIL
jgi:hypothetical protein